MKAAACPLLAVPPTAGGAGELSGGPFLRALVPLRGLHPQDRITSQIPHLLIPSHGGLGFQHTSFGTHKHSVCNTLPPPPPVMLRVPVFSRTLTATLQHIYTEPLLGARHCARASCICSLLSLSPDVRPVETGAFSVE